MSNQENHRVDISEEVNEFLVESGENLDLLDQDLISLETHPGDLDRISSIFRTIHTIKGTCGFLGFDKLESVTHVGENLLSKLRDGTYTLTPELTDVLLELVDVIRVYLSTIEESGGEGDVEYPELIAKLSRLVDNGVDAEAELDESSTRTISENAFVFVNEKTLESNNKDPHKPGSASEVFTDCETSNDMEDGAIPSQGEVDRSGEVKGRTVPSAPGETKTGISESSVRVDVSLLDNLMDLVGELVLARNQILQYSSADTSSALTATTQRLNLITSELQESVMRTRMQPIGTVLAKFPRIVRDLSTGFDKRVRLEFEGKETELDRTIIEAIKDPLTHLIRNSVDHGIETPSVREVKGKDGEGMLKISAYHESGYVNIEIADDGAGIDPERVKAKAIEKRLLTPEMASRMTSREAIGLIFSPGFSTAEVVTNVSGRGVGMDVVKTNIEKIGGSIDVLSIPDRGTTFKIKIPLTLAIVPALIVSCTQERYAIPQTSLVELIRLDGEQVSRSISVIDGRAVLRLRGNLVPLIELAEILNVIEKSDLRKLDPINIVIVQTEHGPFGLFVDSVVDTQEIVVKPLGRQVKNVGVFSGATIMGDGRVALILDVSGLAEAAALSSNDSTVSARNNDVKSDQDEGRYDTFLVVKAGANSRYAISLSGIDRLEEFDQGQIEWTANAPVVQYRNRIMPLLWLASALGSSMSEEYPTCYQVVVHSSGARSVGVVVDEILDITEVKVTVDPYSARLGVLGSAVISGRVTEIVDLSIVVDSFLADYEGANA